MRVLVDTNIVLDFILEREPFLNDADILFQAISSGQIVAYVTATTLTHILLSVSQVLQQLESYQQRSQYNNWDSA